MQRKQLLSDDRGLPPVVGVILMVGITIILAATVTAFVFGFTGLLQAPPQAAFGFDYDPGGSGDCDLADDNPDGVLTISHASGNDVDIDRVSVRTGGGAASWTACGGSGDVIDSTSEARVGVDDDQTVRVVWTSADGDRSSVLATWRGPRA